MTAAPCGQASCTVWGECCQRQRLLEGQGRERKAVGRWAPWPSQAMQGVCPSSLPLCEISALQTEHPSASASVHCQSRECAPCLAAPSSCSPGWLSIFLLAKGQILWGKLAAAQALSSSKEAALGMWALQPVIPGDGSGARSDTLRSLLPPFLPLCPFSFALLTGAKLRTS